MVALLAAARYLGINLRDELAPAATAAGVIVAVFVFFARELLERRRKTLEACEKLLYDKELRTAWFRVSNAVKDRDFQPDADTSHSEDSDRAKVYTLLTVIEGICAAVVNNSYDRSVAQDRLKLHVDLLVNQFLAPPLIGDVYVPTRQFLLSELRGSDPRSYETIERVFPEVFAAAIARTRAPTGHDATGH